MEQFREGYTAQAEDIVKSQLVIDKIITVENIVAEDAEIEERIANMAKAQGKEVPDFKKNFGARQFDYIKNEIIIKKLFAFLKKENIIG